MRIALALLCACLLRLPLSAAAEPLQIYILAGQSNMQGHAKVSTFPHLGMDPETVSLLAEMEDANGNPVVCERVWISSLGSADNEQLGKLSAGFGAAAGGPKIGPEFTFGLRMQKAVPGRILLIKTAWGGRSLNTDFRPPSAGPYVFNPQQLDGLRRQNKDVQAAQKEKDDATGVAYRQMIEHVQHVLADLPRVIPDYDAASGYQLAGFVWFQGWNDLVDSSTYPDRDKPGGYAAYSNLLATLIRDVRRDLHTPQLPFVIGVLGVGGPVSEYGPDQQRYRTIHQNFRDAMAAPAALPEFQGSVAAVRTEIYWDQELTAARSHEATVRQMAKKQATEQQLKGPEEQALYQQLRTAQLTERERAILDVGVSNLEFHYLGSAKILGRIGWGLAEAMLQLQSPRQRQ